MCMFSHFYCDSTILHLPMMLLKSYSSILCQPWIEMCFVWLWYTSMHIWWMCCLMICRLQTLVHLRDLTWCIEIHKDVIHCVGIKIFYCLMLVCDKWWLSMFYWLLYFLLKQTLWTTCYAIPSNNLYWHFFLNRPCEKTLFQYCCFLQGVLYHVYYLYLYVYVSKYVWDVGLYWYTAIFLWLFPCLLCLYNICKIYSLYMFSYVKNDGLVYSTDFSTFHSFTNFVNFLLCYTD